MNVYCITFPNLKRYVGIESTTNARKYAHARSEYNLNLKSLVAKAIRKYGWENCKFRYVSKNKSSSFCYAKEIELIFKWKLQEKKYGYNRSSGGERGFKGVKMSQEHKNKIGQAHKGRKFSKQTLQKMKKAQSGKKLTTKHRLAISKSLVGNPGRNLGKKHTLKTKNKISNSLKGPKNPFFGKTHSAETIAKIVASNKRRAKCKQTGS